MEAVMARKQIKAGAGVKVTFTERKRELVPHHTLADTGATGSLEAARNVGGRFSVHYTLDDLDELLGYVAAEANHSKSKRLQKELYKRHSRLRTAMESYEDGQWQTAF